MEDDDEMLPSGGKLPVEAKKKVGRGKLLHPSDPSKVMGIATKHASERVSKAAQTKDIDKLLFALIDLEVTSHREGGAPYLTEQGMFGILATLAYRFPAKAKITETPEQQGLDVYDSETKLWVLGSQRKVEGG